MRILVTDGKDWFQCSCDQKDNQHLRNCINKFNNTLHHCVHLAATVTGNSTIKGADHQYQDSCEYADRHGNTGTIHNTDQNITAIHVSTKYMREYFFPICLALKLCLGITENMLLDSKLLADGILIYALLLRRIF